MNEQTGMSWMPANIEVALQILGVDPVIVKRFGHYVRLAEDGDTRVIKILDEVGMKRMTIAEALDQLETNMGGQGQSRLTAVTYADAKH
jgi:hypothetical protein